MASSNKDEILRRLRERHAHRILQPKRMMHPSKTPLLPKGDNVHKVKEQNMSNTERIYYLNESFETVDRISKRHTMRSEEMMLSVTANTTTSALSGADEDHNTPADEYNSLSDVTVVPQHPYSSPLEPKRTMPSSPRRFCRPDVLDTSQESFPDVLQNSTCRNTSNDVGSSIHLGKIRRTPSTDHDECRRMIPLGSFPNESLELSAIIGAEMSRIDRTFDSSSCFLDDNVPDDERNASTADPQNGSREDDPSIHSTSQEYLVVSKSYAEVCLPTSYENTFHKSSCASKKQPKDSNIVHSSLDLLDELRNGGMPFLVRKFHDELDEIKADFHSLGEDLSETATEIRHQSQSFLADVFAVSR